MAARKKAAKKKAATKKRATWDEWILKYEDHLRKAVGTKRDFDGWFAQARTWLMTTQADMAYGAAGHANVLAAFTAAAQLGLLIDGEECMVMVRGRKNPKVKCEICAKGVVRKAGQAGWTINSRTIKKGDRVEIDEGQGTVSHTPAWVAGQEEGETIGFYAVATKRGGQSVVRSMSVAEARKRSTGTGAWNEWEDQMGEKSSILQLRKVLYLGDEIEELIASTGAVTGDTWGMGEEEADDADEPQHPPQSARDKVLAQANRDQQDADAEGPTHDPDDDVEEEDDQEPEDEEGDEFVDGDGDDEGEMELPI